MTLNEMLMQKGTATSGGSAPVPAEIVTAMTSGFIPIEIFVKTAMADGTTAHDAAAARVEVYSEPVHRETVRRLRRMQQR
jgi:hypothetical protein